MQFEIERLTAEVLRLQQAAGAMPRLESLAFSFVADGLFLSHSRAAAAGTSELLLQSPGWFCMVLDCYLQDEGMQLRKAVAELDDHASQLFG
jgi:hypothetical protein